LFIDIAVAVAEPVIAEAAIVIFPLLLKVPAAPTDPIDRPVPSALPDSTERLRVMFPLFVKEPSTSLIYIPQAEAEADPVAAKDNEISPVFEKLAPAATDVLLNVVKL
jgi:hypothetical protein